MLPSTLHLFWDLFGVLGEERIAIHMDEGAYAIARWGVERVAARGAPVRRFRHHDPDALLSSVRRDAGKRLRPVVVTDGFCPGCGQFAPLPGYLAIVRDRGGLLVLDDTQALGILGHSPQPAAPYGEGGGGSLRHFGIEGPDILWGSSLAKGFGVPVAVLAGSAARIERFDKESATRAHCSPPSVAVLHAAEHALDINANHGRSLRLALVQRVAGFRMGVRQNGLTTHGTLFPVQTLEPGGGVDAAALHRRLLSSGVRSVLLRGHGEGAIGFLITANHRPEEIEVAVELLAVNVSGVFHRSVGLRSPRETPHELAIRI